MPEAARAETAGSARSANTALAANTATEASRLNGHVAGCTPAQLLFAGACWEVQASGPATAPQAALACASRGGELPGALALAAFGGQRGVGLAFEGEWTGDITNVSGPSSYAVVTIARSGQLDFVAYNLARPFRCVIPLVS